MKTERTLRKNLQSRGYELRKSGTRRIHANDLGGYMIIDPHLNAVVRGARFELSLEDVHVFCEEATA